MGITFKAAMDALSVIIMMIAYCAWLPFRPTDRAEPSQSEIQCRQDAVR